MDVLTRRAVRIKGEASIVEKNSTQGRKLTPLFEQTFLPYQEYMQHFVYISISDSELITSPAYDVGFKQDELVKMNLAKLGKTAQLMK